MTTMPAVSYEAKPWLKRYDEGVPHSLMPYPQHPIFQYVSDSALNFPERSAILTSAHLPVVGRKKADLTYRELNAQVDALACALVDMGLRKGDRVALILPNCAQFVIAFFGVLKAGGVVVAVNPTFPAAKMAEQIKDSGATAAIVLTLFYNVFKSIQQETDVKNVIATNIKEYLPGLARTLFTIAKERKTGHRIEKHPVDYWFQDLLSKYAGQKPRVEVKADDLAIFQYTGGTTGVPKGAMITHQALVCNTLQSKSFIANVKSGQEVFMAAIPLFHVFGMISVMCFSISLAGTMLMVSNPREIKEVLEVIDTYKPSLFMGVPAMYNDHQQQSRCGPGKYDIRSIRACISGSAPLPPATKLRFEELTGGKLAEGYGMSETAVAVTVNPLHGENKTGSIGLPLPDVEMKIISLEDGLTEMPVGKEGELVVWSPTLMKGYHNMPAETDNVLKLMPDGRKWLFTGDIAYMDEDGYFFIVDRKKDMTLIGGFNVYPTNVEKVIIEHPSVQEVAVAGIPHPEKEGQEALKAWVVLKPDHKATEKELVDLCAKKLARYEVPTRIEFVSELPKTHVLKVLRRELVAREIERLRAEKSKSN